MQKSPLDIIAHNLPTYADCYVSPTRTIVPSEGRLAKDAARIMAALSEAGFEIVRKDADSTCQALENILAMHDGNQPAALSMPDLEYARRTIRNIHREARAALGRS